MSGSCGGGTFREVRGTLVSRTLLGERAGWLEVRIPGEVPPWEAGQFALLNPAGLLDPLLGRPLGVAGQRGDRLGFLCRRAGRGTSLLLDLPLGQELDLRLPLGRPLSLLASVPVWFAAGGVGAAPLLGATPPAGFRGWILGVRDRSWGEVQGFLEDRLAGTDPLWVCDDGSLAPRGNVVSACADRVAPGDLVVACGPEGMLRALRRLARERGFRVLLGLERRMACGFGGCLGCRISRADGSGARVCVDGPFFNGEEVGEDVFD